MDVINELILKQFIGEVSHMSAEMADIGTFMADDGECEEAHELGIQLLQITNLLAKYVLEAITTINNGETPEALLQKFNELKNMWPEVYPGNPFYYEVGED